MPVAVISDAFWQRHFASDPAVLGKTVRVDEAVYTIVGVAPTDFDGVEVKLADLWAPLSNSEGGWDAQDAIRLLARTAPGASPRALDGMLTAQYRRTHLDDPRVTDSSSIIVGSALRVVLMGIGAGGVVAVVAGRVIESLLFETSAPRFVLPGHDALDAESEVQSKCLPSSRC